MTIEAFLVAPDEEGDRLDRFLARRLDGVSRTRVRRWIDEGRTRIEGETIKPSLPLRAGWEVLLDRPEEPVPTLLPEPVDFRIVHEDEAILVIDKPPGLTVHPGAGRESGTLVHGLLHHDPDRAWPGSPDRPGLVHRLDRDTSGLLVVARTAEAYADLREQIAARRVGRAYATLVWGTPEPPEGTIDGPIGRDPRDRRRMAVVRRGGRPARSRYRLLRRLDPLSLLEVRLETGRTHQIRVHLAHAGVPVFGDPTYGGGARFLLRLAPRDRPLWSGRLRRLNRQALHAYHLSFRHPRDGLRWVFESPMPRELDDLLRELVAGDREVG